MRHAGTFYVSLIGTLLLCTVFELSSGQNRIPLTDSLKISAFVKEGQKLAVSLDAKAPGYLMQVLKLTDKKAPDLYVEQKFEALSSLGGYYTSKGVHDSAAYYYNKLMRLGMDNKNERIIAKANIGFGLIADYQADYPAAISKFLLALKYAESVRDTVGIATATGNMGNAYIRLKQYPKAIKLLNSSIDLYTKKGMVRQAANNTSSLARAYKGVGNKQKELELKLKALSMFKSLGYKKGIATVCINLGVYYESAGNFTESLKYNNIALQNSRAINDKGNIAILFNNMSDLYLELGKTDTAILYNDSAWYYAKRSGDKLSQSDALLYKANILHTLGRHMEAGLATDAYLEIKDSIYNEKSQRQIADMEVKYETEKKQSQIVLLNKENSIKTLELQNNLLTIKKNQADLNEQQQALLISQLKIKNKDQKIINQQLDALQKEQNIKVLQRKSLIQNLELKNKNLQVKQRNYAITGIIISIAAVLAIIYLSYKRRTLKYQNQLQAEVFKQNEIATKAVFEGEQKERIRIARDLHDSIGQMLSVVKMNLSTQNHNYPDRATGATLELVDKTIAEVRNISHNLIPEELNFGLFAAIEDMCEKINMGGGTQVMVSIPDEARQHHFEQSNQLSIYRIVQEVLGNMVKHSQATEVDLQVLTGEYHMTIAIKDNGKGFDTGEIQNSKGIGWKNIMARVNLLDGEMNVQSEKLTGTQIEITIPG
jgi:two-component system NarL family sensor kinase